jgi:heme-degrading monooxygenase HmoA
MYIAMNRFVVRPGQGAEFERRWRERESHLRGVPGFLRFRLLKLGDTHYSSYAEWESETAFRDWTQSEAFRKAHGHRLPPGILDGPPRLECWEVVMEMTE